MYNNITAVNKYKPVCKRALFQCINGKDTKLPSYFCLNKNTEFTTSYLMNESLFIFYNN